MTMPVAVVRAYLRTHREHPSAREVLGRIGYQLYLVALLGGFWGLVLSRAYELRADVAVAPMRAEVFRAGVAFGTVIVTLAGVRLGTWAGPVLVSRPAATWLLPAPLDRRALLRPALAAGLGIAAAGGAAVGLVVGVVAVLAADAPAPTALAGSLVAWPALAVLAGVGAFAVERSRAAARAVLRLGAPGLAVAAGFAALTWFGPEVALWLPGLGWAIAPVAAGSAAGAWAATGVLAATAIAVTVWADAALVTVPDEELHRRAGVAAAVRASTTLVDFRTVASIRRSGQRTMLLRRGLRLRRPHRRLLATPWRDAVTLLRRRGVVVRTLALAAAGGVVAGRWPGAPAAVALAALPLYLAAADLTEGLRTEQQVPAASELLPDPPRTLALGHLVTPLVGLTAALGTVVAASALVAPLRVVVAAAAGAPVVAAMCVAAAGLAATRGDAPLHLLAYGEMGLAQVGLWLAMGPLIALVVVGAPLALAAARVADGAGVTDLAAMLGYGAAAAAALVGGVAYRTGRA